LAVEVEDVPAVHHGNVDAIAIENITAHDRPPMERARSEGCAFRPAIASQKARSGYFPFALSPISARRRIG
jgi:hypothetical protein